MQLGRKRKGRKKTTSPEYSAVERKREEEGGEDEVEQVVPVDKYVDNLFIIVNSRAGRTSQYVCK
jgi:hypothetical protein